MLPTLRPGDRLVIRYGVQPTPGRLAVVRFADGTVAVKRVVEARSSGWWVVSDNPHEGVDSRHRGAVGPDAVVAVVLSRLPRLCARLRSRDE